MRKVARLDTGCAAVLDRIPGSCVCGTEIGCGLDSERFTAQRKVSEVSQSVRRSPRVQTRRRERERNGGRGGGYSRCRQCDFAVRFYLTHVLPKPMKTWSWRWVRRISPDLVLYFQFLIVFLIGAGHLFYALWLQTNTEMKFPIETPRKQVNWDPEQGKYSFVFPTGNLRYLSIYSCFNIGNILKKSNQILLLLSF